ncbi:MAG: hypothetical protein AMS24_02775 [Chlamydiae bacterium SM23_39]|nr:MAG: hypothetical protein AMS24_02775 [Chlamydiae bacterium SM23_39]
MKKIILTLSLLFFLKDVSANDIFENKRIEKINIIFKSQKEYDSKKIISSLKTKKDSLFSQAIFDEDIKMLSKKFEKIEPSIKESEDQLIITIYIYPRKKIAAINFKGNYIFKDKKLLKQLKIKKNEFFNEEKFKKALNNIKDFYIKKGFFESEITYTKKAIKDDKIIIDINVKEGRSGKIKYINFKGFTKKEEKELSSMLYSKKYNIFTSWLTGKGILKKEAVEQDQMTIINYLNNKGYADAKVNIFLKDYEKKRIIFEIVANKGPLYHFGKITFSGNKLFSDKEIKKQILIKEKDIFSPDKIRYSIQSIKDLYGEKGYINTQVINETFLSETKNIYNVHFDIEEGDQFKIGLIHIIGNTHTNANVILRESLLVPGKVFNLKRLKATQKRLENMGYFKDVKVYAVKTKEKNYKDVYIEVTETSTGSANLSAGLSKLNNFFVNFELTERNFNVKGLSSLFSKGTSALRGAGEYAHAKVTVGKKQRSYLLTWMNPYFKDSLWRTGFEISKTFSKLQSKDYKIITYGGSIFASYPITNYFTFGTKYRIRHSVTHLKKAKNPEDVKIEDNYGLISAISYYISYDSTDMPYKPTKGLKSLYETEFSGLGGDFYFFKFNFINSLYIPIWSKGTLKFRADLKFLEPTGQTNRNDLPLSEKFFLGGETSVRGYKPYILGPRRKDKKNDPIGGISSTLLSVEYAQNLIPRIDLFVFFDSGCITKRHFSIPKLNASYGIGTRLELNPNMPITLGYGIPINPDYKGDKQQFFFSFGGQF